MLSANIAISSLLLVLGLLVLIKKDKKSTDYFLFITVVLFALYPISIDWIDYSLNRWSFAFYCIVSFSPFLPFFIYAMLLISRQHRVKKKWFWFFTPHLIFFAFVISDIFIWNDYTLEDINLLYYDRLPYWPYLLFFKFLQLYIIGIMIWFLRKLKIYQSGIKDYYSNVEHINLDWLKYFSWLYIVAYGTSFVAFFFYNIGFIQDISIPLLAINIATYVALFWMIYKGIKQFKLASFSEPIPTSKPTKKYSTSSLTMADAKTLFGEIKKLFEQEKIFHNPDLKVQDLAESLGVNNHNISQVLNEIAGKSFYDFVNGYRLSYFKDQLADPEKRKYTILALGMESGFNSKASLNRVFKQQLGETPREYQKRMLA